ncbi:FAD-dependent oxidoreductase [Syntrophomonas wolfei]|uniref:FAD-dependent oxidoreductase n=1 Tax=Syntrophomonas wolfei TaxID=863 RepID=UPI0009ECB760|nr:FAD-dependent oxidoreductase [Syntrophomonas wolfei]
MIMAAKLEFPDNTNPYWIASTEETNYPMLNEDINVDVAIIGGGIVGISSAYLLNQAGLKTAVIEADRILNGTTGHTTAKITSQHGIIYSNIKQQMGEDSARQYAEANQSAIQHIAETISMNGIDCDFKWCPAFVYTCSDEYISELEEETQVALSLGIKASYLDSLPLPFAVKAAMRFDEQAQFHPLKYLKALAQKFTSEGGLIYENTEAVDIDHNDRPVVVTRKGNKVTAEKVIIASHFPFFDGGGLFFTKIYPEKSYIVAAQIEEQFPEGMFISAEGPGRSLRSQPFKNREIVLFAGEHHRTGHGEDTNVHYQNLFNFAQENFNVQNVLYRWSTQDCMTIDGVPYVGQLTPQNPNLYVATGFGKWGMSNGTAASMILKDLISEGDNPWARVYSPSRFFLNLSSVKSFIIQNATVAKDLVAGKLEGLPGCSELDKGEAQTINFEGDRVGIYRDENDKLHMVDTTCTHLGCELLWNNAEKTWDCPCHGSRFSYKGEIVEGPAIYQLHQANDEANIVEAKIFK